MGNPLKTNRVALGDGSQAKGDRQMGFSDARGTEEKQVFFAINPAAIEQVRRL